MKIKLKDLTKKQLQIWKEENCEVDLCDKCIFKNVHCGDIDVAWYRHKELYSEKFLNQEVEINDENIQSNNNI